jgi:hypothetical protein
LNQLFKIIALCIAISEVCVSCSRNGNTHNEKPIARVYDAYLYPADVKSLIAENTSEQDSTQIIQAYIDSWIRHNLELKIAEDNVQSAMSGIDKQVQQTREELIIYAYESQWLRENLDTIVTEDSLRAYYDNHIKDFILDEDIYNLSYGIINKDNPSVDSLKYFLKATNSSVEEAKIFCNKNCLDYSLDTKTWVSDNALFNILPLDMYANGKFRTYGLVDYVDENKRYIVKVDKYFVAGGLGPFEYYRNIIGDIIINKRKLTLLKNNQQKMYQEGLKRNNAEIFTTQ